MGKRNKLDVQTNAMMNKRKKLEENDASEQSNPTVIDINAKNRKTKTKKKKENKDISIKKENSTIVKSTESDCLTAKTYKSANKRPDNKVNGDPNEEIEKKSKRNIKDKSIEVNKQANTEKKSDFSQEDDVKEEDIDKFCDEIDEEDNLQYLNWVEQIEAKLNSNKRKPK